MQAFVPKNRRPKFELLLKIIDLNNVPLVSGSSFVKWHLPHSTAAEHRGRTQKCGIKEHKVTYDYEIAVPVRLTVDKSNVLQETHISFEVIQEYGSGIRDQRVVLGHLKLNLAEYVEPSEEGEEAVCRRYLMQDSKINSTIKVTLYMKQLEGERNFIVPPLRSAPVFGNIAGIVKGEKGEADDLRHLPSLSLKAQEAGELQDLYRRTLAAALTSIDPMDLRADLAIEDIFAGGDGWGSKARDSDTVDSLKQSLGDEHGSSDNEPRLTDQSMRNLRYFHPDPKSKGRKSPVPDYERPTSTHGPHGSGHRHSHSHSSSSRGSIDHTARHMKAEAERMHSRPMQEVNEFDIREDLRSWRLPESIAS